MASIIEKTAGVLLWTFLMVLWGCGEKDVPYIIDADEIAAYVQSSPEAQELFRTAGLFPEEPYEVAHQGAWYKDRVVSHNRIIDIDIVPLKDAQGNPTPEERLFVDYGSLGFLREGWATVKDNFEVETTRMFPGDTVVDTTDRRLVRYGFFLKLGRDAQAYVGWTLYGYNGLGRLNAPLTVRVTTNHHTGTDTTFLNNMNLYPHLSRSIDAGFGVREYRKLSDIIHIKNGAGMLLETEWASTGGKRDYPLLTADGNGGAFTTTLGFVSREEYRGIIGLRAGSERRYDFVYFQCFHDDEFFHVVDWFIPYRLF